MSYDAKKEWTKAILETEMAWPSENVIRIFKGRYPRLYLGKYPYKNKKICDVGCGDGRNLVLLKQCGFDIHGIEITQEIINKVMRNFSKIGIDDVDLRVGTNDNIPYKDEYFDYLLSWEACYYMGKVKDFSVYVR